MANGKILRQLFRAGTTGDADAFRLASKAVIEEERQKQHHLLANDLEQILYGGEPFAIHLPDFERLGFKCDRNPFTVGTKGHAIQTTRVSD